MRQLALLALLVFSMLLLSRLVIVAHAEDSIESLTGSGSGDVCPVCHDCPGLKLSWDVIDPRKWWACIQCMLCQLKAAVMSILDTIRDALTAFKDAVIGFFDTLWTAITYPFVKLKEGILAFVNGVKSVFSSIASALGYAGGSIKDAIVAGVEWLKKNVYVLFLAAAGIIAIRYAITG